MKYGMNLLLWTAGVTEEHYPLLARLKEIGFDGVELPLFVEAEDGFRSLTQELNNLGLGRTGVCVCTPDANPISSDARIRQAALDFLKQRIDWSATLGVEVLCGPIHSALGSLPGRGRTDEEWGYAVEILGKAADYAAQANVKLSVEPLNRFEVYFLNTAADANRLVQEIGHPSLGYLYDSFHANIEERDIRESVTANASGINHVHISENDRGVPGAGHVRWQETFSALKEVGYDGWLTIEAFGRALPELAAATCVWRDLFENADDVPTRGFEFMKRGWEGA